MKTGKTGITAVLLGVAFAATSFAATTASATPAAKPLQHTAGKISAVDASAMSLTIAVNGKSEQVSYTASTAIREGGKNVAASALATGEKVKVAFEAQAGKNIATSIEIFKGAGAATPAKSK